MVSMFHITRAQSDSNDLGPPRSIFPSREGPTVVRRL